MRKCRVLCSSRGCTKALILENPRWQQSEARWPQTLEDAHVKHFSELQGCVFSELKFAAVCPSIIFENRSCRQRRK